MAKYNVFESTNMGTTHYAEFIRDAVAEYDVENGTFGYLDGLVEGETHIYNFKKGTKDGEPIVVADNPAWTEDTCKIANQRRDQYIIKAGTPFRVRTIKKGDKFATAIEGITTATQEDMDVGAFVTIDSTTGKLVASAATSVVEPVEASGDTEAVEGSIPAFEGVVEYTRISGGTLSTPYATANGYGYGSSTKLYVVKVNILA